MNGNRKAMRGVRVVLAGLVMVATACGSVPATHFYVLEPRAAVAGGSAAGHSDGWMLGVLPFQVDPPYDQDRIVYRVGADSPEVAFYDYHRWAAPLSRMLPRLVAAAFDGLAGIRKIEPVVSGDVYDGRIRGRLLSLEEIDNAAGQHVRLRLQLTLIGPGGEEIWSSTVDGENEASAGTVEEIVEQMRGVLEDTLRGQRDALAAALAEAG